MFDLGLKIVADGDFDDPAPPRATVARAGPSPRAPFAIERTTSGRSETITVFSAGLDVTLPSGLIRPSMAAKSRSGRACWHE